MIKKLIEKFNAVEDKNDEQMALSMKNYILLAIGFVVIVLGMVLMCGGGSESPEEFNYAAAIVVNQYIRIVPFHSTVFHGFRDIEFWCYRKGIGSGNWGTVVQNGMLAAIHIGYKTIELYGVDHTLLDGLMVDDRNRLCRAQNHYYDSAPAEPKPIYYNATNPPRPYTMSEYLAETAELFRGHEVLRDYAKAEGVRIINRTAGSLIDAFERNPML